MNKPEQIPKGYESLDPKLRAELVQSARLADAKAALLRLGVGRPQIEMLVNRYPLRRIERQLRFLPYRQARKPSSLIVSAIMENYERPAAFGAAPGSSSSLETEQSPNIDNED